MTQTQKKEIVDIILEMLIKLAEDLDDSVPQTITAQQIDKSALGLLAAQAQDFAMCRKYIRCFAPFGLPISVSLQANLFVRTFHQQSPSSESSIKI